MGRMRTWRRAYKGHRCGFCGKVFDGGEPLLEIGSSPLKRCQACAKARYGEDVPVPFPEPEIAVATVVTRKPAFASVSKLATDYTARLLGEKE